MSLYMHVLAHIDSSIHLQCLSAVTSIEPTWLFTLMIREPRKDVRILTCPNDSLRQYDCGFDNVAVLFPAVHEVKNLLHMKLWHALIHA